MQKTNSSQLSILTILLLLSFLALFQFSESEYRYISFAALLISAVAMHFLSATKSFIWLLILTLTIGFGMLLVADSSINTQLQLIKEYFFFTAALIVMWLLYSETKQVDAQLRMAQKHAKELEKYIGSSELLTVTEFMNRVKFISTGTRRRMEENHYLRFQLNAPNFTQEAFDFLFSKTLLSTVRTQFDLVTKLADGSYLVFLQNTKKEGSEIVIDRFIKGLTPKIKTETIPFEVEVLNEKQASQYVGQFDGEVLI